MILKNSDSIGRKVLVFGFAFLLLVLLIASFFGKKGLVEITRIRKNRDVLLREVEELKTERGRLEKEIADLENNPKAVERKAREELGLVKPDEKIIIRKKTTNP